jgi:hypothetical protein
MRFRHGDPSSGFAVTFRFHPTPRRDLRLFEFCHGYYAGSWFLDDVDDGFNLTAWRFQPPLFLSRSFLRYRFRLCLAACAAGSSSSRGLRSLCALSLAVLLRGFARFFGSAFARFFRLAMISSPPLSTAVQFKSVCAGGGSIKQDCERAHSSSEQT